MSNERIDLTQFEGITEWEVEKRPDGGYAIKTGRDNFSLEEAETLAKLPNLIAELKRCYEELDSLPTRWQMSEIHNYTKWLETVESYFLADGSFNQDADFVRKCAVNEQYGYRIEVIDGVETEFLHRR